MEEDRFEIELTPAEEHRSRRRQRAAVPTAGPGPPEPLESSFRPDAPDGVATVRPIPNGDAPLTDRWFGTERGRLVTTAAVAAIIALLLGWMLGRAGRGDSAATDAIPNLSTAADERVDSAPDPTILAGDTIPPVRTTAPRRTPTTTIPAIEIGTLPVDGRLAGVAIELVGWAAGQIVEADLGTGSTRTIPVDERGGGQDLLHVGRDWVLISNFDGPSSQLVLADGSVERAAIGEPWSTLRIPGTDRFWRLDDNWWLGPATFAEVRIDGSATGVELEIPRGAQTWVPDADGGILTTVAGGVYAVDADSAILIGRGDLVAAGPTTVVLHACDDRLDCGYVVVDRATSSTRTVLPVDDTGEPVELGSAAFFGPPAPIPVSPDGRWAAVIVIEPSSSNISLLDLDSGRVTELARHDFGPGGVPVFFSAGGRYAFHPGANGPHVFDLQNGEHFPVFTETVFWNTFGVRDATDTPASTPPSADTTEG